MDRGYIHLYRKIRDCKVLQEPGKRFSRYEAWIDIILDQAQGVGRNGLARGEFEASSSFLARRWNWSKSSVKRFMADLQEGQDPMIMRVGQSADHLAGHSVGHFIVCKYYLYNPTRTAERTSQRTTERTQINNVLSKGKEGEKDSSQAGPPDPRVLLQIFEEENKKLPQVQAFTPDRLGKCRTRINRAVRSGRLEPYLKDFRSAVATAQRVPFLCGETGGWRANFDFFIQNDKNIYGILEGKYGKPKPVEPGSKRPSNGQPDQTAAESAREIRSKPPEERTPVEASFLAWFDGDRSEEEEAV